MIAVLDYGVGNVGSVLNMLKRLNVPARLASNPEDIEQAQKLILPGVGHFDRAMESLRASPALAALERKVLVEKTPILGICLGMQILMQGSEEGSLPGLGWVRGHVRRFQLESDSPLKIPNMGWARVRRSTPSPLTEWDDDETQFYFVHAFYARVENEADSLLKASHGIEFDAGIRHENIYGVQFHPEKSHRFGMRLLDNFARRCS